MGVPATTGVLRDNIADMEIGDYIKRPMLTESSPMVNEIPITGLAWGTSPTTNDYYYLVKISKGLLVCDRVLRHSVSWDSLNTTKSIQGQTAIVWGVSGINRSITGGVAYVDANGNMSLTDKGFGGFPTNNEWDRYIVNFPINKIQSGKTLDDVFHWSGIHTWVQDTSVTGMVNPYQSSVIGSNTQRVLRGSANVKLTANVASNSTGTDRGFRPVFEFQEA